MKLLLLYSTVDPPPAKFADFCSNLGAEIHDLETPSRRLGSAESLVLLWFGSTLNQALTVLRALVSENRFLVAIVHSSAPEGAFLRAGASTVWNAETETEVLISRIQALSDSLMKQVTSARRETEVLYEALQTLVENLDSEYILDSLISHVARVIEHERCSIVVVDPEHNSGNVVATGEATQTKSITLDLAKYPEIQKATSTGQVVVIDDMQSDPLLESVRNQVHGLGFQSLMVLPMKLSSQVFGTVFLRAARASEPFREKEIRFCQMLADIAATALGHAQLLDDLKVSEERFRQTIEASPHPLFSVDDEGRILSWNSACELLFGYPRSEIIGSSCSSLLCHQDRSEELKREIAEVWRERSSRGLELDFSSSAGDTIHVLSRLYVLTDRKDRVNECFFANTDLTELRLAEQEKIDAIAALTGGIAHDFNNSLTAILGSLELLKHGSDQARTMHRTIDSMSQSADRMAELTSQLLAYSRRGKFLTETINLGALVLAQLRRHNDQLRQHQVETVTVFSDRDPLVMADQDQLKMVVGAIIQNAIEASEPSGLIQITVRELESVPDDEDLARSIEGRIAYFEVVDSGCGMSADTLDRLFEPFFSTKIFGRGLGMAATYGIVKNHDGEIRVKSEPGVGTKVQVFLPTTS